MRQPGRQRARRAASRIELPVRRQRVGQHHPRPIGGQLAPGQHDRGGLLRGRPPARSPARRNRTGRSRGTRRCGSRSPAPTASPGTPGCRRRPGSTSPRRTPPAPGCVRQHPEIGRDVEAVRRRRGARRRARRWRTPRCRPGGPARTSRRPSSRRCDPERHARPRRPAPTAWRCRRTSQSRSSSAGLSPTRTTPSSTAMVAGTAPAARTRPSISSATPGCHRGAVRGPGSSTPARRPGRPRRARRRPLGRSRGARQGLPPPGWILYPDGWHRCSRGITAWQAS